MASDRSWRERIARRLASEWRVSVLVVHAALAVVGLLAAGLVLGWTMAWSSARIVRVAFPRALVVDVAPAAVQSDTAGAAVKRGPSVEALP